MPDDESSEVYSKLKDYPQIIKGVEDDSKSLIKTQNDAMAEQFGSMRYKITQSLEKLHLGVIQKTVDKVVQNILTTDLKQINENINTHFMSKFNGLLGNLITNVDEIINVGKILDAADKVNEYITNLSFDDALALLDLTIDLIHQEDLAEQKQKLIERREEVLVLKEEYHKNVEKSEQLEEDLKGYKEKYLLNEIIETCEELIELAPRIAKLELINKYTPILESARKELDKLKKETIMANENFDVLVNEGKVVDAYEVIKKFKEKWYLYLEEPPIESIPELFSKVDETWDAYTKRQQEITDELGELESGINDDISNDDFTSGDSKWERADELLFELYEQDLKDKWVQFRIDYQIKKRVFETIQKVTDLLIKFNFEQSLTLLNTAIDIVVDRNFLDDETKLKTKKDEVYAAQAKFNYQTDKIKKYEDKFNENYYRYYLHAALNYCERIIELSPEIGRDDLAKKYKKLTGDIQKELENMEMEFLKEMEELESDRKELSTILEIDEDVLPLLEKFAVDDILGDLTGDINDSLDQVKSLLNKNRVEVKREITNKAILRSASGEMIESETEVMIDKIGEEDTESLSFNAQSILENPFEDTIEDAILTDLVPYNFEITNIEINGKPVEQLPDKTLTKDGLEVKWQMKNIPPKEKLAISYDLRRRVSRTIIFILEGELKVVKTHSTLDKLKIEGFYDAKLPFKNTYGVPLEGVIIEDIIPLYYLHIIKAPTTMLPSEKKESKLGEIVKWDIGKMKEGDINHHYRLLELYRYEEIKIAVDSLNKDFINFLDKGELTKAVDNFHKIGGLLEEYHTHD